VANSVGDGSTVPAFDRGVLAAESALASSGVLQIVGLAKRYGGVVALDNINLDLPRDCYVSLLGPSGSGKTVLLRIIAGFEEPDAGTILFAGESIVGAPAYSRGIGFVFQNFALFPHLSVFENIAFGLKNRAQGKPLNASELRDRVQAMIELVGLAELESRGVHQISGGQRQRVALARTLVTEPRLVLLDEPLGALDANLRTRIRGELRNIRERLGVTFLHVTGSETEALAIGDKVIVLDRGHVAQMDSAEALYERPASARIAHFLNCFNLFDGKVQAGAFTGAAGAFPLSAGASPDQGRYGVRYDAIVVRAASEPTAADEVGVPAVFIASEYTGPTLLSFFRLASGQVVEVEAHLGHQAPPDYAADETYHLTWRRDRAQVFA
jgi:ABC-type Fe3+/spermidine/putrescine transport system ATPase subunit